MAVYWLLVGLVCSMVVGFPTSRRAWVRKLVMLLPILPAAYALSRSPYELADALYREAQGPGGGDLWLTGRTALLLFAAITLVAMASRFLGSLVGEDEPGPS